MTSAPFVSSKEREQKRLKMYHHEAQGLDREMVGHWTIPRAVATTVPDSTSNPIQFGLDL